MGGTHIITEQERRKFERHWAEGLPLSEMLPYRTPCGFLLEEINAECTVCRKPIAAGQIRVKVTRYPNGVDELHGAGLCCTTVTWFLWRFRPEGRLDSLVGKTWRSYPIKFKQPAWWDVAGRLRRLISRAAKPLQGMKK
jgi:hypothetical protein